jgi:hypothetical protein
VTIPTRIQRLLDDRALETIQAPEALLQMGTAILAAAGYRTRGAQGHHANTFYAVAALTITGLEELDVRAERIRQKRKLSAYLPGSPTADQINQLHELLDSSLPAARQWLAAARPRMSFA